MMSAVACRVKRGAQRPFPIAKGGKLARAEQITKARGEK
jgi:hypothetical protein